MPEWICSKCRSAATCYTLGFPQWKTYYCDDHRPSVEREQRWRNSRDGGSATEVPSDLPGWRNRERTVETEMRPSDGSDGTAEAAVAGSSPAPGNPSLDRRSWDAEQTGDNA